MSWAGFAGSGFNGGHVQVTAYSGSNERCVVTSWSSEVVTVRCFDTAGNPADSLYTILFLKPDASDSGLAFAWANDAQAASYTPTIVSG